MSMQSKGNELSMLMAGGINNTEKKNCHNFKAGLRLTLVKLAFSRDSQTNSIRLAWIFIVCYHLLLLLLTLLYWSDDLNDYFIQQDKLQSKLLRILCVALIIRIAHKLQISKNKNKKTSSTLCSFFFPSICLSVLRAHFLLCVKFDLCISASYCYQFFIIYFSFVLVCVSVCVYLYVLVVFPSATKHDLLLCLL